MQTARDHRQRRTRRTTRDDPRRNLRSNHDCPGSTRPGRLAMNLRTHDTGPQVGPASPAHAQPFDRKRGRDDDRNADDRIDTGTGPVISPVTATARLHPAARPPRGGYRTYDGTHTRNARRSCLKASEEPGPLPCPPAASALNFRCTPRRACSSAVRHCRHGRTQRRPRATWSPPGSRAHQLRPLHLNAGARPADSGPLTSP